MPTLSRSAGKYSTGSRAVSAMRLDDTNTRTSTRSKHHSQITSSTDATATNATDAAVQFLNSTRLNTLPRRRFMDPLLNRLESQQQLPQTQHPSTTSHHQLRQRHRPGDGHGPGLRDSSQLTTLISNQMWIVASAMRRRLVDYWK